MKKISLNEAAEMFEMISDELQVLYNTETGEFILYNEDFADDDPEEFDDDAWISAPDHTDINEYDIMVDFIDTIADSHTNELLCVAINGKGAFRRFKDTLYRVGLIEEWYAFKHKAYAEIVKKWCKAHELDYEDDLAK